MSLTVLTLAYGEATIDLRRRPFTVVVKDPRDSQG